MVLAFATSADPYVQAEWKAFREEFVKTARIAVTGGDFPTIYQEFSVPAEFPGYYDAGVQEDAAADAAVRTDGGTGHADAGAPAADAGLPPPDGEAQELSVLVNVTVQVPRGEGRSFGVEFTGKDGATSFSGNAVGVTVTDGMKPVEIGMLPYLSITGKVQSVSDLLKSHYDDMKVGTVGSFIFTQKAATAQSKASLDAVSTGSADIQDSATFGPIPTTYAVEPFVKDGQPLTYASVFLHGSSDNGFTGFCVPGSAESPGTGLEPGMKVDTVLYMASRSTIGSSNDALLSCVSPQTVFRTSLQGVLPTLHLSFMTKDEPTYVKAVMKGANQFEQAFDDRLDQGGTLSKPGLDVGFTMHFHPAARRLR